MPNEKTPEKPAKPKSEDDPLDTETDEKKFEDDLRVMLKARPLPMKKRKGTSGN
ncbi:MAG: hypothetical protein ABSD63_08305 [Candidatus Korobacteraceae bacterium]|jgi:hypothetical protein